MKVREMIEILFPDTAPKSISEVVNILNLYGSNYGLGTSIRVAHFLAQVREEIGSNFEPIRENLNYTPKGLVIFKQYRENYNLAIKHGRTNLHPANQEMIANIVYANRLGNGNIDSGDGYKYRGAGALQVTGKYNFVEVQLRIGKYSKDSGIDILSTSNDADSLKGSLLMGMAFWVWKDLYKIADKGITNEVVDKITLVINLHTESYKDRCEHFNNIKHLIH